MPRDSEVPTNPFVQFFGAGEPIPCRQWVSQAASSFCSTCCVLMGWVSIFMLERFLPDPRGVLEPLSSNSLVSDLGAWGCWFIWGLQSFQGIHVTGWEGRVEWLPSAFSGRVRMPTSPPFVSLPWSGLAQAHQNEAAPQKPNRHTHTWSHMGKSPVAQSSPRFVFRRRPRQRRRKRKTNWSCQSRRSWRLGTKHSGYMFYSSIRLTFPKGAPQKKEFPREMMLLWCFTSTWGVYSPQRKYIEVDSTFAPDPPPSNG